MPFAVFLRSDSMWSSVTRLMFKQTTHTSPKETFTLSPYPRLRVSRKGRTGLAIFVRFWPEFMTTLNQAGFA